MESKIIESYDGASNIEEGGFLNDKLNGNFGRRICMNGEFSCGWFSCLYSGKLEKLDLHGYGKRMIKD